MHRRAFLLQAGSAGMSMALLAGCEAPGTASERAVWRDEIESGIPRTLETLHRQRPGSRQVTSSASGLLIFPSILRAGIGFGGEYGRGALRIGGRTNSYYALSGGSVGLQLGAERRSMVIAFLTPDALSRFRSGDGWTFGAETSVAGPESGAAASASNAGTPVVAYLFGNSGLMVNASIEGTKVTRLDL